MIMDLEGGNYQPRKFSFTTVCMWGVGGEGCECVWCMYVCVCVRACVLGKGKKLEMLSKF